jgi:hypothetical protein
MATQRPTPDRPAPARPGSERRRWARAEADFPVTIALASGKAEARVRDLSRAGVCFYLDRAIPLMTVLEVVLDLGVEGGVRKIRGQGAVVRCEKIAKAVDHYEIALFLHELSEPDREAITDFVAARAAARG